MQSATLELRLCLSNLLSPHPCSLRIAAHASAHRRNLEVPSRRPPLAHPFIGEAAEVLLPVPDRLVTHTRSIGQEGLLMPRWRELRLGDDGTGWGLRRSRCPHRGLPGAD